MSESTINISTVNIYFEQEQPQVEVVGESLKPAIDYDELANYTTAVAGEWEPTPELSDGERVLEKFFDIVREQYQVLKDEGFFDKSGTSYEDDKPFLDTLNTNLENLKEIVGDRNRPDFAERHLSRIGYDAYMATANIAINAALQLHDLGAIKFDE